MDNLEKNTGISEYPEFNEGSTYSAGDVVSYNGLLYQFTTDHAAGAFDEGQVEETSLKGELENKIQYLRIKIDGDIYSYNKYIDKAQTLIELNVNIEKINL